MDGENTTMYHDYIHARSLDSKHHPSRNWVKSFHASIAHLIPSNLRICGEDVYAVHSIEYSNLESYFYGFSVWEDTTCLSWDDTVEYFELLGITSVPVLYRGRYDEQVIKSLNIEKKEGYVIRLVDSFNDFAQSVAKYVRPNHVQTEFHWMHGEVKPNKLKEI